MYSNIIYQCIRKHCNQSILLTLQKSIDLRCISHLDFFFLFFIIIVNFSKLEHFYFNV